jgi:hypothetical protein
LRSGNVSGWYARLDRECLSRHQQIDTWLDSWELALKRNMPIASVLPDNWPTLPASLLTDPGHVLDQLLCRYDAQKDGRSPRGAHPIPTMIVDAILADELKSDNLNAVAKQPVKAKISLSALPPGFHSHATKLNGSSTTENHVEEDEETMKEIESNKRTRSGIPLPFADPASGGGLFAARLIRWHSESSKKLSDYEKQEDIRVLLSKMQLFDISQTAKKASERRIFLELVRCGIASLNDVAMDGQISRTEAEELIQNSIKVGNTLLGEWPWDEKPRLLLSNPPWLRIKDRFRGHENGSQLRKELGRELRTKTEHDGSLRFSTLSGNVNLYRLFIERSLQLVQSGGRIRLVTPDSFLREQSSAPLRTLLVNKHEWTSIWAFPDASKIFAGVTQGVLALGLTVGGETDCVLIFGPIERGELCHQTGLKPSIPCMTLERERWANWSRKDWSVPRLPRNRDERDYLLAVIDELSSVSRLSEPNHWLSSEDEQVRVKVGEVDQTNWSSDIHSWRKESQGIPFVRGIHFISFEDEVWLHHPAFDSKISGTSPERKQALWKGKIAPSKQARLACQAIVNAQQTRRLRWIVLPSGCVLGNSVNHLQIPDKIMKTLAKKHKSRQKALEWICQLLNSEKLDVWARAWAANNNVNNYELELLPLLEDEIGRASQVV